MRRTRPLLILCLVVLAGCGGGGEEGDSDRTVSLSAAPGEEPYANALAERAEAENDGIAVEVRTDAGLAHERCAGTGLALTIGYGIDCPGALRSQRIAIDANVVVVPDDTEAACVSSEQLQKLLEGAAGTVGADPATGDGLPAFTPRLVSVSVYGQDHDGLKLVSVDDGAGCIPATAETIQDGTYPLLLPITLTALSAEGQAAADELAIFRTAVRDRREIADAGGVVEPGPSG